MKKLLLVAILVGLGYVGYSYYTTGEIPLPTLTASPDGLPTRDAQGRELVPCNRCLATGLITCTGQRCKDGKIPCPGRCLKLSDPGWQRVEKEDPNKLFMIYHINGGWIGRSQAHVGEVFEVRLGKFYELGVCKTCNGSTFIPCKVCNGAGKVTCTVCAGQKVVVKAALPATTKSATGS